MTPTERLKEEHRMIETVLGAIEAEIGRLNGGAAFRPEFFEKAVDFIRNFADGVHHAKEENQLFPLLEQLGIPRDGGPVGCMLKEHEEGRAYVKGICDALELAAQGDSGAPPQAIQNASNYATLLRNHIYKEDNILYPAGDQMMGAEDQAKLSAIFDTIDEEFAADGRTEKYRQLANELVNGLQPIQPVASNKIS